MKKAEIAPTKNNLTNQKTKMKTVTVFYLRVSYDIFA